MNWIANLDIYKILFLTPRWIYMQAIRKIHLLGDISEEGVGE